MILRWRFFAGRLLPFVAILAIVSGHADAEPAPSPAPAPQVLLPLLPGDLAVTGFSGSKLATDGIAPGIDPVQKTIIDLDGASLKVIDGSLLGASPTGQVVNPAVKLEVRARDIGQVFGLALDDHGGSAAPDLYVGATSAFGLQIVAAEPDKDGSPRRLEAGAPGAKFMAGQFGGLLNSGPGTIFKIDGTTGAASVFADTGSGKPGNSGPALAGLAIDGRTRSLYAADLDTGLVHRFAVDGGGSGSTFDHGTTGRAAAGRPQVPDDGSRLDPSSAKFKPGDPATWGLAPAERRVSALAAHDGRLYYAVAEGPEVWSVAIGGDGGFGSDPRLETAVPTTKPATVAAIAFDADSRLIVALRGAVKSPFDLEQFVADASGRVLAFEPGAGADLWAAAPKEFAIGAGPENAGASGGVTLTHGLDANGRVDTAQCNANLAATGDLLSEPASDERVVHGIQMNAASLVKPGNVPPNASAFADFDGQLGNTAERGHVGSVLAVQVCNPSAGGPAIAGIGAPGTASAPPGGGAAFGSGAPGEAGEEPQRAEDELAIDPDAPNMAISKTRSCSLPAPDTLDCEFTIKALNTGATPFDFSAAAIEDNSSVPPIAPAALPGGGAEMTPNGFRLPGKTGTIVPPGNETPGLTFKSSFRVPPEGLVVENCASITFPGGGRMADPAAPVPAEPAVPPGVSVALAGEPQCTENADGKTQDCTFLVDFTNASQGQAVAAFKLATDIKPEPGLDFGGPNGSSTDTVDGVAVVKGPSVGPGQKPNPPLLPVTGTFPKGPKPKGTVTVDAANVPGDQPAVTQGNDGAPQTLAEQAKAKAAVSPSIKVSSGPLKNDSKTPGCELLPDGNKACQWFLDVTSPVSDFTNAKFAANFSVAPKGTIRTDQFGQNPVGNSATDGKNFAFNLNVPRGQTNVFVSGIFPGDQPDPVLNASTQDFGTAGDPDKVLAALAKADQTPSMAGGIATGSTDSNPADNTSCVTFDTNNPDAPDVATNEPTQGTPVPDANAGDPGARPDDVADAGEDQPPPPLPGAGDIAIDKTGSCTSKGAGKASCLFDITVTNTGTVPFPIGGTMQLEDSFSIPPAAMPLLGTQFPGAVPTPAGFAVIADPANPTSRTLQPGGSFKTLLTSDFDVPPEGLTTENCAELSFLDPGSAIPPPFTPIDILQDGAAPAARTAGLDRGIKIEGDPVCVARGGVKDCTWTVTLENPGDQPIPLAFEIDTNVPVGQFSSSQQLRLSPRDGHTGVFESQVPIPPGTSKTVVVQATVPAAVSPVTATVKTIGSILTNAPAKGLDTNTANDTATADAGTEPEPEEVPGADVFKGDTDPANNRKCVTVTMPGTGAQAAAPVDDLTIVKSGGPLCNKLAGPGVWSCVWQVDIINNGATPFSGNLAFDETMSLAGSANVFKATGGTANCATGVAQTRACTATTASLAPNEKISLLIGTTTPFASVPVSTAPGDCKVTNQVVLRRPGNANGDLISGATSALEIGKNEGKAIPCDPPALKLTKTAAGCQPSGGGFDCKYRLTVTSIGPDPFEDGTIDLEESIPEGATIRTGTAGWTCGGSGASATCRHGKITLAKGASTDLDVVMSLPKGAIKPGQCEIRNDARIVQAGRDMSSATADLSASATARIDSPECTTKCYGGMVLAADGNCSCPGGEKFDTRRGKCPTPGSTLHNAVATPQSCTNGMKLDSSGSCRCPTGSVWSGGACLTRAILPPPRSECPLGWTGRYPDCRRVTARDQYEPPRGGTNSSLDSDEPVKTKPRRDPPPVKDRDQKANSKLSGGTNGTVDPDKRTNPGSVRRPPPRVKYCYGRIIKATEPCNPPATSKKSSGGQTFAKQPEKPKCPASKPNGTPPYCCPSNSYWVNGACRGSTAGKKTDSGTAKSNSDLNFRRSFKSDSNSKATGGQNQTKNNANNGTQQKSGRANLKFRTTKFPGTVTPDKRVNYGAAGSDVKKPDQGPR